MTSEKIGPGAKRIVVRLGRDTAADHFGIASVAAAGALDTQFERRQHGNRYDRHPSKARLEENGAFEDHILRLLPLGPGGEVGTHGRMHQRIQIGKSLRIGKDNGRQTGPVECTVVAVGVGPEARLDTSPQLPGPFIRRFASLSES